MKLVYRWMPGVCLALQLITGAWAATAQGQAAAYLKFGIDSRILGMGGAGVALSRDVNSTYWNPAGLAYLKDREGAAMHTSLSLDRNYNYFAIGMPSKIRSRRDWVFGLAYHRFSVGGIPETRVYPGSTEPILTMDCVAGTCNRVNNPSPATDSVKIFSFFEDAESYLSVTAATRWNDKVSLGGSFKFLNQTLFTEEADGIGFDVGVQYQHSKNTTFGLTLRDMFESLDWSTGRKDDVPLTLTLGGAVKLQSGIHVAVDVLRRERERTAFRFGLEQWFWDRYGIRVGNNEGEFTVGASAKLQDWTFDFAYNDDDLGSVQRISLKRRF
jgi:hypothetical protein